jgi:hypothetical protein
MLRNLAILFLATAMMAQTAPPAASAKKPAARKPATTSSTPAAAGTLTDDSPVLFVPGLCNLPATAPVPASPVVPKLKAPPQAKCMRQVTKRQFEALVKALGPRAQAADKAKIAEFYARALAIENQVRKLNLEQTDPDVREALWMARVGALGEILHHHFQKQFANVPDSDVQAYYDQHKSEFEEATIQRVVIPKPPQPAKTVTTPPAKPGETAPESPSAAKAATPAAPDQAYADKLAAMKAGAEKMIERAKAGEDLGKLQKEAFTAAGIQGNPPDVEPVAVHHSMLPPAHDKKVFALAAGEYTALIEEPNAFMFYKVVSKRTVPLAEVKNEITQSLAGEKEDAVVNQIFGESQAVMNPDYFTPPKPETPKPAPGAQPEAPKAEQPPAPQPEAPSEPPK